VKPIRFSAQSRISQSVAAATEGRGEGLVGWALPTHFGRWWAAPTLLICLSGCSTSSVPTDPPTALTREQFATLYNDHKDFTNVWYMGSDAQYHHFIFEHWTIDDPNSINGHMDLQKAIQVPVTELGVRRPFPLTYNKDQWRLMRPHGDPSGMPGSAG
jgi:hypothetical protein